MIILIVLFWSLTAVLAVWFSDVYLLFVASLCMALELLHIRGDFVHCTRKLQVLLKLSDAKEDPIQASPALTSMGDNAAYLIEVLKYRLTHLAWGEQVNKAPAIKLTNAVVDKKIDFHDSMCPLLESVHKRFRARDAYLILWDGDRKTRVFASAESNQMLSDALQSRVAFVYDREFENLRFSDHRSGLSVFGDLSRFGIRYSLCAPLSAQFGQMIGLVFLGYSEDCPPLESESNLIEEVAHNIVSEVAALNEMNTLNGRVCEVELSDQRKSDFIAQVSHDIRSPLNNVKSILNLIKLEGLQADTPELLETALDNCEDLKELVETILDFSKHQAGKLEARPQLCNLSQLTSRVCDNFRISARLKGLELNSINQPNDIFVNADPRHLKRIVTNLLSNAVKYTKHGKIEVAVEAHAACLASLEVRDTGVGLSSEQIDQLFTPFAALSQASKQDNMQTGIGLGLALSKVLAELNDGSITVSSQAGMGTCFRVSMPTVERNASPVDRIERSSDSSHMPDISNLKILLVDDNPDCIETLGRALGVYGINVIKSITVQDAIGVINFEEPDVIIADHSMPDGGAASLLEFLNAKGSKSKLVVLSGSAEKKTTQRLLTLGAQCAFEKPLEIDQLLRCLGQFVKSTDSAAMVA